MLIYGNIIRSNHLLLHLYTGHRLFSAVESSLKDIRVKTWLQSTHTQQLALLTHHWACAARQKQWPHYSATGPRFSSRRDEQSAWVCEKTWLQSTHTQQLCHCLANAPLGPRCLGSQAKYWLSVCLTHSETASHCWKQGRPRWRVQLFSKHIFYSRHNVCPARTDALPFLEYGKFIDHS